jgi:hypothetical protein
MRKTPREIKNEKREHKIYRVIEKGANRDPLKEGFKKTKL